MDSLVLNCFPAEVAPTKLRLPYLDSPDWDASGKRIDALGIRLTYRYRLGHGVRSILLSGGSEPIADGADEFDIGLGQFGGRIVDAAVANYLQARGMEIDHTSFETTAMTQAELVQEVIGLYTGIAFKARKPFRSEPHQFVISAQWKVSTRFVQSIAHPAVGPWSENMPVLYKPLGAAPPEIQAFQGRFLGRVMSRESSSIAVVRCRDGVDRRVPEAELYPEGSPEVISRFEDRTGGRRSVWRRVQQLGLVFNSAGRRNVSVLRGLPPENSPEMR